MDKFLKRFEEKYIPEPNSGCWLWIGAGENYGHFRFKGRNIGSHRAAYLLFKGEIPEGFIVDHKCKNKLCVNPQHLQAITQQENVINGPFRGQNKEYRICKRGHIREFNINGKAKNCRKCENLKQRERRAKRI